MAYKMWMRDDGILRIQLDDDLVNELDKFTQEFTTYLDAATEKSPLYTFTTSSGSGGKLPSAVRKMFAELNRDPRLGKSATIGLDRYTRVLAGFVLKATGRNNIRFFDTEEEALAWLKEKT
jgi:hypothetical protein